MTNSQIILNWKDKAKQKDFLLLLLNYLNSSHFNNPQFNALKHPDNESDNINFTEISLKISSTLPNPQYLTWLNDNSNKGIENYNEISKLNSIYPSLVFYFEKDNILNYRLLFAIK